MKNNTTILAVVALLTVFIISCNTNDKDNSPKDNQVEFDTIVVKKKHYLKNDSTEPFCDLDIHFVYPIKSDESELQALQKIFIRNTLGQAYETFLPKEAIETYTKNFLKNYEKDALIFQEELNSLESRVGYGVSNDSFGARHEQELHPDEFYSYHETLSNKIFFNKSDLLSFQVHRSNNKGGSATYSAYNNFVINLKTSRVITENDLFSGGYDVALQQLFEHKLMKENEVSTVLDLEDLGYFGIEEIMPNSNFLIDENGLTYIFNKGEYSAYLLDAPEVFIPYSDIRMLLKENTVVSQLAQQ